MSMIFEKIDGYNRYGCNRYGCNRYGYNRYGYNRCGYNRGYKICLPQPNLNSFSKDYKQADNTLRYSLRLIFYLDLERTANILL